MADDAHTGFRIPGALLLLSLAAPLAFADGAFAETAVSRTWDDPKLEWAPCPPFMPKGCGIAVLHGDPAKANADVFFKVPAGAEVPSHWHTSAERMVLVSGELRVTYAGQPPATLKPGTYAYGPAKAHHTASCAGADPCVLFIAFESPVDAVATEPPAK